MKKHFLLVVLTMVVFLWRSVVMAQSVDEWKTICWVTTITEDNVNSVTQTDQWCCTEDGVIIEWLPACTQEQIDAIANTSASCKANEHLNSLGFCVCNTWFKPGTDPCKPCSDPWVCCGISLNTSIPFIGNCIEDNKDDQGVGETNVTGETAFPVLMWSLTKILVTVILIVSFVLIIVGGIMIATGNPADGKKMIIKVVIGIALLWASGVVLRLINPNFFG